ncbi:MAG TPA: alpha/beta hydrolase [Quisquiliibacterium sp.]|nr:alpha/beta hydrolase [Quisquiliibacterium sp.]
MTTAQLDALINTLRSRPAPAGLSIAEMRERYLKLAGFLGGAPDAQCEKVDACGVPAEWVAAPGVDPSRAMLMLHGGGYAIGSIDTHRRLAHDVSVASGARVLLIDYRLAPEHPFPAAVDDAAAAWRWMLAQGLKPSRLSIVGDSAGGGLVLSALVALRDQGAPLPACAVAISPWVDLEMQGGSVKSRAGVDPMVAEAGLHAYAKMYLGDADPRAPLASPLHADLAGLPPVLVQVGSAEVLLDDALRIAEKLHAAGNDARLSVWPNMPHVFPFFAPVLSEGGDGCREIGEFVRQRTA